MALVEVRRVRHGIIWRDDVTGQFTLRAAIAPLHFPLSPESLNDSERIDINPVRVTNAQLDGWSVVANDWYYALGIPAGRSTDGWVGFGGRQGQHWLWSRLVRLGYLHYPTRAWDDIGGAPTYTRANLSQSLATKTLGGVTLNMEARVTWTGIWTTPGGGRLDLRWRVQSRDLKEDVIVNAAARSWIAANRPPSTPAAETYFGLVFQIDASDIPRWLKGGLLQDLTGDFDDDNGTSRMELRDALDRLLAFLPVSDLFSAPYDHGSDPGRFRRDRLRLRKRIWRDGDGNTYLLVGVRVDQLATFPAGDLTFDPTFEIAESAEDANSAGTNENVLPIEDPNGSMYLGSINDANVNYDGAWIFRNTGIASGSTVTAASMFLYDQGDTLAAARDGDWWGFAVDVPADFLNGDTHRVSDHHARTSASVADDWAGVGDHSSPSLVSIVQEIVNRAGFAGDLGLTWRNVAPASPQTYFNWSDFTDGAAVSAELTVTWIENEVVPAQVYPFAITQRVG